MWNQFGMTVYKDQGIIQVLFEYKSVHMNYIFHSFFLEYPKPTTGCASWKVVLLVLTAFCLGGGATYGAMYILDYDSSSSASTDQPCGVFLLDAYF